ncbi:hypothetical protein ACL2XN_18545 [Sodalis sp. RH22]
MTVTATPGRHHSGNHHFRLHGGGNGGNTSGSGGFNNTQQLETARRRDFQALTEQFQYHINLSKEVLDKALAECQEDHDGYHSQPRPATLAAAEALDNDMRAQVFSAQHKKQSAYQALSEINDRLCHLSTGVIALHKELSTNPSTSVRERYLRQEHQLNLEKTKRNNLDHAARARAGQVDNALKRKNETGQILAAIRNSIAEQKAAGAPPEARKAVVNAENAANSRSEPLADKSAIPASATPSMVGNTAIPASVSPSMVDRNAIPTSAMPSMAQVNARRAIALSGMAVAPSPRMALAPVAAGVNGGMANAAAGGVNGLALRTAISELGAATLGLAKHPLGLGVGLLAYSGNVGEGSDKVPGRDLAQRFATAPLDPSELASAPGVSCAAGNAVKNNLLGAVAGAAVESAPVAGAACDAAKEGKKDAALALGKAATEVQAAVCRDSLLCVAKLILTGQSGSTTETVPVADDLTGGKLENPSSNQDNKNVFISPDQRGDQRFRHTGNIERKPYTDESTTVTPIPEHSKDKFIYLSNGKDNRLPISEPTVANNGLKVESNAKHTPGAQGSRPNAGVEPRNSLELFDHSIATKDPKIRLAIDNNGNIHRFFNTSKDGKGNFHWSGSSGDEKNALGNRELGNFNREIKELKDKK